MQARNVTHETLTAAAQEVGVVADISTQNQRGTRHRVKLNPLVTDEMRTASGHRRKGERGDTRYQRTSAGYHDERRVHAVCWHGFRDFFRAVYRREPDAVFATAYDTWRGSEDFEARFRESGHKNVGSQMCPRAAAEVCRCPESGSVSSSSGSYATYHFNVDTSREPLDTYGADEADGAACRAMANALRAAGR